MFISIQIAPITDPLLLFHLKNRNRTTQVPQYSGKSVLEKDGIKYVYNFSEDFSLILSTSGQLWAGL